MSNQIRFDRLKTLADHLMTGKLGHDRFYFGEFHIVKGEDDGAEYPFVPEEFCGTLGCALGEMPTVDPVFWKLNGWIPQLTVPYSTGSAFTDAEEYFGIEYDAVQHLFNPSDQYCAKQDPARWAGQALGVAASKEQVAENIYAFIEKLSAATSVKKDGGE